MPFIKVQSSVASPEKAKVEQFLKTLSAKLAQETGKPESYVMTIFEPEVSMTFAGTSEPVCYVEIKSIGLTSSTDPKNLTKVFSQIINQTLGVPVNRIFIEFSDPNASLWGWNNSTFG